MAGGEIKKEMAASYAVTISGVERTRSELAKLDTAIRELRRGTYSPITSATVASSLGGKDLLVTKFYVFGARIQTHVKQVVLDGMDMGKALQIEGLRAATTPSGLAGRSHSKSGRKGGAGRDDTGTLIKNISRNVEYLRQGPDTTTVVGFHGWGTEGRGKDGVISYAKYQEKGSPTIQGANSLGLAIPPVREFLKRELGNLGI